MVIRCSSCGAFMPKVDNNGKKYFLCTVDTNTTPANIDVSRGLAVDVYGCVKCGTITLNSELLIGQQLTFEH